MPAKIARESSLIFNPVDLCSEQLSAISIIKNLDTERSRD